MSDMSEFCTELMHWLDGGRSPWHTVAMAEQALTAQGFTPLELGAPFAVKRGGRYFVSSGTFLAAVTVGAREVFRIAASHTDWPWHAHQAAAGARFRRLLPPERGALRRRDPEHLA